MIQFVYFCGLKKENDMIDSPYASIAAISRVSGINQHQLSHYANGLKKPRPEQRRRIVEGLHKIGRELMAVE